MADSIETVIAGWREKAAVLRATDHAHDAQLIEALCEAVDQSTLQLRRFVSESDACLFSGKRVAWLRARFGEWERRGLAEWRHRARYYRLCALPQRADLAAAREAGLRGDTGAAGVERVA